MRQAGILAAAGLHALENNIQRLETDHNNAEMLATGLSGIKGIKVDPQGAQTNILFVDIKADMAELQAHLKADRIIIDKSSHLRLVTHLDINAGDIEHTIEAFKAFFT